MPTRTLKPEPRNDNLVTRVSKEIQDTESTAADEALPQTRLGDDDIFACVGTASKEEFVRWMTVQQALPAQKLELVVDLPECRGLVASPRREPAGHPGDDLDHGGARDRGVQAQPRAQQPAGVVGARRLPRGAAAGHRRGEDVGRFATYFKALPRRTGDVLDWLEDDIKDLLVGSLSQRAVDYLCCGDGERPRIYARVEFTACRYKMS